MNVQMILKLILSAVDPLNGLLEDIDISDVDFSDYQPAMLDIDQYKYININGNPDEKNVPIGGIIFGVAVVGGGSFYVYKKYSRIRSDSVVNQSNNNPPPQNNPSPVQTNISVQQPTVRVVAPPVVIAPNVQRATVPSNPVTNPRVIRPVRITSSIAQVTAPVSQNIPKVLPVTIAKPTATQTALDKRTKILQQYYELENATVKPNDTETSESEQSSSLSSSSGYDDYAQRDTISIKSNQEEAKAKLLW